MNGFGVHRIDDVIASQGVGVQLGDGSYGRAVPERFYNGLFARLRAAWQVATGRAVALEWPSHADLNRALRADH